ncbi:MAG TPA: ethanolamine ammonia-lyase reactivating factor EutA [Burkholderiales bacterium]|nr:ethanolamine ammonia-lyase reactivating factor EutA [Burkholderiales bacterium]
MPDSKNPKPAHSLADHLQGRDYEHTHDGDEAVDHDHDHFFDADGRLEDNALWIQDHVSLLSVGIDIGSSGTQVIFSRINLRRMGEELSSRYFVVSRETLFQSPVSLTPYRSEELIDDDALGAIIDQAFADARLHPDDVDTGVVILTGEALRRENAEAIAGLLAEQRGEFVCATAGHHMESMLAAFGSGAARVSHESGKRILNVDIGGGTTKLALVEGGNVIATAALHVGGRLMVVDEAKRIVRLDPAGKHLAAMAGFRWSRGDVVDAAAMERVADRMAGAILAAVSARAMPGEIRDLFLTAPLPGMDGVDGVMFSGGVAEYVYQREPRDFGDLGRLLGVALRRKLDEGALPWPLLPPGECIRATALGASEYSVQLSGNTIYISNPGTLLPRRNLQVLQPRYPCQEHIDPEALARAIREHFQAFDLTEGEREAALALRWEGTPSYERIAAFAHGIRLGLENTIAKRMPVYVMVDGDIAQTLGAILSDEMGVASELLVIDGVILRDFDYIDLGRIRMPSLTVPVTVKSLVFSEDPRNPRSAHKDRSARRNIEGGGSGRV